MKECPKCHNKVIDSAKFCLECGNQLSIVSDVAKIPTTNTTMVDKGNYSEDLSEIKRDEKPSATFENKGDEAALAFVYIAQYVRSDGPDCAGVLVDDCEPYFQGITHNIEQKLILERQWYKLRGYMTTPEGSYRAKAIIEKRTNAASNELTLELKSLPLNFVLYFRQEVLRVPKAIDICLMREESKIGRLGDDLWNFLRHHGLAETPSSYVGTHGGTITNQQYTPAPEVLDFFDSYLASIGRPLSVPVFDEILEAKHQLYHALKNRGENAKAIWWDREELHRLSEIHGAGQAGLKRVFIKLEQVKAIGADPGRVFVTNSAKFQEIIRQEFLTPLVEHILSSTAQTPEVMNKPGHSVTAIEAIQNSPVGSTALMALINKLGKGDSLPQK